jgi:hypothetical protein
MVRGTNSYDDTAGSSIVVITAGVARKPGMSRDDLLNINTNIVKQCAEQVKASSPDAIVIIVSNPLDVMAYVAKVVTGFPEGARHGDGRRPRHGAVSAVHRDGAFGFVESVRRSSLAATAIRWSRCPRLTMVGGVP